MQTDGEKKPLTAEEVKNKGNECVKEGKFEEAAIHYTHALKLDPTNYVLYSNRSFAFLKIDQHYLALQDANETVRLEPNWAKGYYRRGQVEAASGLYDEAIISYSRALQLQPLDSSIMEAITKTTQLRREKIEGNQNLIWVSTCVGLIIGLAIVVLDYTLTEKPTLTHPISMVAFALAIAGGGWTIGKTVTLMRNWQAGKSLTPPEELETSTSTNNGDAPVQEKKSNKYTKAQARQRYKQGKSL